MKTPQDPYTCTVIIIILIAASAGQQTSGDDQSPVETIPMGYTMTPSCGGMFNGQSGDVVASPNYPQDYTKNAECIYIIEADVGHIIRLTFHQGFDIESSESQDCNFDYLEIHDGRWGYAPLLGIYCGYSQPFSLETTGRLLWMRFVTDDTVEETGFIAHYEFIAVNMSATKYSNRHSDCIVELEGNEGEIDSLTIHPGISSADLDCTWQITAPLHHKILLIFDKFELKRRNLCEQNSVSIYDRMSVDSHLIEKYCSGTAPDVLSESNRLFVRYTTGSISDESHFIVHFTAFTDLPCNSSFFQCGTDMCINSSLYCNGRQNCYHYAWDENSCPREGRHSPLMETYAGALFGALSGLTVLIIGLVIIMSCRNSIRQQKRRASLLEYRRRSLAALSTGVGSHTEENQHRLSLPAEFNASSLNRHGSIRSQYTDPGEYHEMDNFTRHNQPRRLSNCSRRSSSPSRKLPNSHTFTCPQPTTLHVPSKNERTSSTNGVTENPATGEETINAPPSFNYEHVRTDYHSSTYPPPSRPYGQYTVQYYEPGEQYIGRIDTAI